MGTDIRRTRGATLILATVLLLTTALAATGCTTKIVSEGGTVLNTVTSSGTGEVSASPDEAIMNFGVTAEGEDAAETLDAASATADTIIAALKDLDIDKDDLQTQNVNVWPRYDYRNDNEAPRITGYEASIMVRATLRDLGQVGEVITAATAAGANQISGPSFTLSQDAEARDEAIVEAVDDARRRAETMAQATGKSVGDVISISETGVDVPIMYRSEMDYAAAGDSMSVPIEPGTLDIAARVTVVFELK
ncbi:MAG: SIMPL domain-containing protein [Actinomycetota bacterium]|jgi:uncharacterized protein YggE|nr:SIMPL domain-containing protein [Actinomycetota bacterium]